MTSPSPSASHGAVSRPRVRRWVVAVLVAALVVALMAWPLVSSGLWLIDGCHVDDLSTASAELSSWPGVRGPALNGSCDVLEDPYLSFTIADARAFADELQRRCVQRDAPLEGDWFECRIAGRDGSLIVGPGRASAEFSFN